jgi:hypothetical protein
VLQRIVLHLARCHEFPEGSATRGYELIAPLDSLDHLNAEEWKSHRAKCRTRRFWSGEDDRLGFLVHHGGAHGGGWAIHYAGPKSSDEEKGVQLGSHRFVKGEYVSLRDEEETIHTFKIISLQPLDTIAHSASA